MDEMQIKLSAIWVATMLVYLLGDVLRIFAGDFTPGEMQGAPVSGNMFLIAGIMMLVPILMVLIAIFLPIFFLFNAVGIPGYPGVYDKVLLSVSLAMNLMVVWIAWKWV